MSHNEYMFARTKLYGDLPIARHTSLYQLKAGKKYTDILPCAKKYDTIKTGYNSKERMGRLLFGKIVNAYLHFFWNDLIYSARTIRIPAKGIVTAKIILLCNNDNSQAYDSKNIIKNVFIRIVAFDYFYKKYKTYSTYGTHRIKNMIIDAYRNGTRYNNDKNDLV